MDIAEISVKVNTQEAKNASRDIDNLGKSGTGAQKNVDALALAAKYLTEAINRASKSSVDLSGRIDNLSGHLSNAQKNTDSFNKTGVKAISTFDGMSTGALKLGRQIVALASAYVGFRAAESTFSKSLAAHSDYESALIDMAKVTDQNLSKISADIMAMPRQLGDPIALMQGYYQTISAGVTDASAAMNLLTTASKASKAAHVEQAETIKALTKLMTGFDGQIKSATDASDLLFRMERLGQTSFRELVPVIGDVAATTHAVGISQNEMAAGLSLITQTSGSTAEAATKWRSIMIGLYKPTENMEKVLKALGYASGEAMIKQNGLAGSLQLLQSVASNSGFSLGKLFESQEALTGISALSSQGWGRYQDMFNQILNGANETNDAYSRLQGTFKEAKDTFDSTIKQLAIEFGSELAPQMIAGMDSFTKSVQDSKEPIVTTFGGIATAVGWVTDAILLATKEYNRFSNIIAGGIAVATGKMSFGDWAFSSQEELVKKMQQAGDRYRKEQQTQSILHGSNTGTIPELSSMFGGDLSKQVDKITKKVTDLKVALKSTGQGGANSAARYAEQAAGYLQQALDQQQQLQAQLEGDTLSGKLAAIDKKYDQLGTTIRKSMIGAKGATGDAAKALDVLEQSRAIEKKIAETKAWHDAMKATADLMQQVGEMSGDMGLIRGGGEREISEWARDQERYFRGLLPEGAELDKAMALISQLKSLKSAENVMDTATSFTEYADAYNQINSEEKKAHEARLEIYEQDLQGFSEVSSKMVLVRMAAYDEIIAAAQKAGDKEREAFAKVNKEDAMEKTLKDIQKYGEATDAFYATLSLKFGTYKDDMSRMRDNAKMLGEDLFSLSRDISSAIGDTFGDVLKGIAKGTLDTEDILTSFLERAGDAFGNFAQKILEQWINNIFDSIAKQFTGDFLTKTFGATANSSWSLLSLFGFAHGGAFAGGTTLPTNSILTSPTLFTTADSGFHAFASGGLGVAGEKGYEAIMPLKRMSNNDLGVKVDVGQGSQRQQESKSPVVNANTKVINVVDGKLLGEYMKSSEGEKILVNVITRAGFQRG